MVISEINQIALFQVVRCFDVFQIALSLKVIHLLVARHFHPRVEHSSYYPNIEVEDPTLHCEDGDNPGRDVLKSSAAVEMGQLVFHVELH